MTIELSEQECALRRLLGPFLTSDIDPHGPLAEMMLDDRMSPNFQPIADLKEGNIFAHEALIRGSESTSLASPDAMLMAAKSECLLYEFEIYCLFKSLKRWGDLNQPGRLFLNISADVLVCLVRAHGAEMLASTIRNFNVSPRMVVLELTEHERVSNMDELTDVVQSLHLAGLSLALDDFGDGRSSLRLWSQIKPDIVKIDKYFCRDISAHADNLKTLQALMQIADIFGTALVAEGIENSSDLRVLRDLGIPLGQGYHLRRPSGMIWPAIREEALGVIRDAQVAVLPERKQASRLGRLRHLTLIHAPCVSPETSNNDVAAVFMSRPELHAMAVVEAERPVAIINRQQFMNHYATLYFREVFGRKSCMLYANNSPRLVEIDHDIDELVGILTSQDQRYLQDGFVVTENGCYRGLGTGDQLVRSVTEVRLEAARHANPLTFLPGNIPISMHIRRLLDNGASFAACYLDLNNFKPFNDHYGFWRGDEMIRLLAKLAVQHADSQRDFVGHVGGDDFLILFQSEDWIQRCELLLADFAHQALQLYDESARLNGGIQGEDRHGVTRFFPCTTLSIGAVPVSPFQYRDEEEVANDAALAKHEAKLSERGLWIKSP